MAIPMRDVPNTSPDLPSSHRTALVDTSLLIELLKRETESLPVRRALGQFRFRGASTYSDLEFKRAWLKRLAYIHCVCRQPGSRTVSDVINTITTKLAGSPYQGRRLQTCISHLLAFLEIDLGRIADPVQLVRLRAHCKRAVLESAEASEEFITARFRGTGCVRAEEPAKEQADGSLDVAIRRCRPTEIRCAVHTFFQEHLGTFKSISDAIDQSQDASDELRRMAQQIRQAATEPLLLCDDRNCRKLADALIAVDGREMDVFAANNDAEWKLIASVMDKPLLNPVRKGRTLFD
jgi:hypothetical protein